MKKDFLFFFFLDFVPLTCLYTFEDQLLVVTDDSTDGKINTRVEKHFRTLVLSFSNAAPEGYGATTEREGGIDSRGDPGHRQWQSGRCSSERNWVSKTTCRD